MRDAAAHNAQPELIPCDMLALSQNTVKHNHVKVSLLIIVGHGPPNWLGTLSKPATEYDL